jgi:hypothetical protein
MKLVVISNKYYQTKTGITNKYETDMKQYFFQIPNYYLHSAIANYALFVMQ